MKDQDVVRKFQDELNNLLESDANLILESVEDKWKHLKINLLKATEVSCGLSENGKWRKQTWWWDISVNDTVKEKGKLWKIWKNGGSKEDYVLAKKVAKRRVFAAKKKAKKEKMKDIETDTHIIYLTVKQMKQENKDINGEKFILDDNGVLAFTEEEKKKAWKQHYKRLLNVEFPWREEDLSTADLVLGPPSSYH